MPDEATRTHLRRILGDHADLVAADRVGDLPGLLATSGLNLLVVAPWDGAGVRVAPTVREVREDLPSLPIVIYCALTPDAAREVVALVRAGADEVIFRDDDARAEEILARLLGTVSRRAANEAMAALHPVFPPEVAPILSYCLDRAEAGVSVAEVAAAFRVHRRTLGYRLTVAGLPSPACLISWCRLLVASRLMEDPGRPVEQVALGLGFGSAAALRNMLRRYTGLRPSELREHGGMRRLLGCFLQSAIRLGAPELPDSPPCSAGLPTR